MPWRRVRSLDFPKARTLWGRFGRESQSAAGPVVRHAVLRPWGLQGAGKKALDYVPAERLNKYFKMRLKAKVRWGQDGSSGLLLWAAAYPSAWPAPSLWALTHPRPGGRKCKGMTTTEMKKNILIRKIVLTNILR